MMQQQWMRRALILLALPLLIAASDALPSSEWTRHVAIQLQRASRYPVEALAQGIEGSARVELRVTPEGEVASVRLRQSSGSALLDAAALEAARNAGPFPPLAGANAPFWVALPVSFRIES
ncbi:TonB family protein [Caenibius sp. WL]|uniref:TonB family protein n=1 Tax=Caenibius sp. WL TaxID=2872646 RepID=UPI001C9A28FF|nr:TonB family protein [Caenibius sp. WL]